MPLTAAETAKPWHGKCHFGQWEMVVGHNQIPAKHT